MAVTDPIADMFTRIRNAIQIRQDEVVIPFSNLKHNIAKILKEEGFIKYFELVNADSIKKAIKIGLKYSNTGRSVISRISRVSKPSNRVYVKKADIPKVLNGYGICIVSTPKGVLNGKAARLANVGGEFIGIIS
jgi:small subunit ribosomal protein S8